MQDVTLTKYDIRISKVTSGTDRILQKITIHVRY